MQNICDPIHYDAALEHHIIIIIHQFYIIIIIEQHIYIFYGYLVIYIFFNVFETLDSVNLYFGILRMIGNGMNMNV